MKRRRPPGQGSVITINNNNNNNNNKDSTSATATTTPGAATNNNGRKKSRGSGSNNNSTPTGTGSGGTGGPATSHDIRSFFGAKPADISKKAGDADASSSSSLSSSLLDSTNSIKDKDATTAFPGDEAAQNSMHFSVNTNDQDDNDDDDEIVVDGEAGMYISKRRRKSLGDESINAIAGKDDQGEGQDEDDNEEGGDGEEDVKRRSYIEQWEIVLATILGETSMDGETHLLNDTDLLIICKFRSLSEEGKELFVKLMMRKYKVERMSKLNFPRITDLQKASEELVGADFAIADEDRDLAGWLNLLTRPELQSLAKDRKLPHSASATADALRTQLIRFGSTQSVFSFTSSSSSTLGLTAAVKAIIDYQVQRVQLTWPTRPEFIEFMEDIAIERDVSSLLNCAIKDLQPGDLKTAHELCEAVFLKWRFKVENEIAHVTGIDWLQTFTPGWVETRIVERLVDVYSIQKDYEKKISTLKMLLDQRLFLQRHRGYWYDELVKTIHMHGSAEEAYKICLDSLTDPMVQWGSRRSIENRVLRLAKKLNKKDKFHFRELMPSKDVTSKTIVAEKVFSESSKKAVYLDNDGNEMGVEHLALKWWTDQGWQGFHSENSIIMTLFGLLFWDILFDDSIAGVFVSPFQDHPLDLTTEFFFKARQGRILERLRELEEGKHLEIIERVDMRERPFLTQCRGVNWKRFTTTEILEIADCFGGHALSRICEGFSRSYWAHSGGVPDLCVWRMDTKQVKLVEVKGQGDRLSQHLTVLLDFLIANNVDVEVFHVALPSKAKGK
ncbi:Fanconi-associated nuclease 1 [Blyttiomyces sp. JEL0837]|nr:Fanconi-associated nuclease 1 [Blyttiomyces sp. JEL0837]